MPEPGEKYRLTRAEGIGRPVDANGYVKAGTVVTVRETVAADEPGAHDSSEKSVVVEVETPYVAEDENGKLAVAMGSRAFSVGVSDFKKWFEKVDD